MKAFTLIMLGTDTKYLPGAAIDEGYPRGELLSFIFSNIITDVELAEGEFVFDELLASGYFSPEDPNLPPASPASANDAENLNVAHRTHLYSKHLIEGPSTAGNDVAEKIGQGMAKVLKAIGLGQYRINLVGHSRGAVESVLITRGIYNILNKLSDPKNQQNNMMDLRQVIEECAKDEQRGNAGNIYEETLNAMGGEPLFFPAQLVPDTVKFQMFLIDPVPGAYDLKGYMRLFEWRDPDFFKLPPCVELCRAYHYENERTDGFESVVTTAEDPDKTKVILHPIYGHHGTGSSGSNLDQQGFPVPEGHNTTHCQLALFIALYDFLDTNGMEFSENMFVAGNTHPIMVALQQEINALDQMPLSDVPHHRSLVLCTLYDQMFRNHPSYLYFNGTRYAYMSHSTSRRVICLEDNIRTQKAFTTCIPPCVGFVNMEHRGLLNAMLPRWREGGDLSLVDGLNQYTQYMLRALQRRNEAPKGSAAEEPNPILDFLDSAQNPGGQAWTKRKEQVVEAFQDYLQRVTHAYLTLVSEESAEEKECLLFVITKFFQEISAWSLKNAPQRNSSVEKGLDPWQNLARDLLRRGKGQLDESIMEVLRHFRLQMENLVKIECQPEEYCQRLGYLIKTVDDFKEDCSKFALKIPELSAILDGHWGTHNGTFINVFYDLGRKSLARMREFESRNSELTHEIGALRQQASEQDVRYREAIAGLNQQAQVQEARHQEAIAGLNQQVQAQEARHQEAIASLNQQAEEHFENQKQLRDRKHRAIAPLYRYIQVIKNQARSLECKGHLPATNVANALARNLEQNIANYLDARVTLDEFKAACNQHITEATPELEKQRGWKQLLANILLFVLTLGVGYVVMASINKVTTGRFLFFGQTRSQEILLDTESALNTLEEGVENGPGVI